MVSNGEAVFFSAFWPESFKFQGASFKPSHAYHPKSDGQAKVIKDQWKCIFDASLMPDQRSDISGCRGLNIATTLVSIVRSK